MVIRITAALVLAGLIAAAPVHGGERLVGAYYYPWYYKERGFGNRSRIRQLVGIPAMIRGSPQSTSNGRNKASISYGLVAPPKATKARI